MRWGGKGRELHGMDHRSEQLRGRRTLWPKLAGWPGAQPEEAALLARPTSQRALYAARRRR
eukprot:3382012-Alexandrium_andersonii.AAC.1